MERLGERAHRQPTICVGQTAISDFDAALGVDPFLVPGCC